MLAGKFLCEKRTGVDFRQWYEHIFLAKLFYIPVYSVPISTYQTSELKAFLNSENLSKFAKEPSLEHKLANILKTSTTLRNYNCIRSFDSGLFPVPTNHFLYDNLTLASAHHLTILD